MTGLGVGVIGLQGDVREHIDAFERAFRHFGVAGSAIRVRSPSDLQGVQGLVIPGGESTTISKLLTRFDLRKEVVRMAADGAPVLGTCAGCVLLAKEGDRQIERTGTDLLGLMDMSVDRNAFGPQRESFESTVTVDGIGGYPGIFIRAPLITRVWGNCRAIGRLDGRIVLAQQDNLIGAAFHPELTDDPRFYGRFFELF